MLLHPLLFLGLLLTLLLLVQAYGPSSAVILPLTLTVLAFAGTLVFIRLLGTTR